MEIRVNDQPLDFQLENERTLGEVVRALERWLAGSQLALSSLRQDGRELLGSPPAQWADTPHSAVGRLELTVEAEPARREAARRLAGELEECIAAASEVPLLLQTGGGRQAMAAVVRFSDLAESVIQFLSSRAADIGGQSPPEFFGALNRVLQELIEAFSHRDAVLIGDLMEYEIAPRLTALRDALTEDA